MKRKNHEISSYLLSEILGCSQSSATKLLKDERDRKGRDITKQEIGLLIHRYIEEQKLLKIEKELTRG